MRGREAGSEINKITTGKEMIKNAKGIYRMISIYFNAKMQEFCAVDSGK